MNMEITRLVNRSWQQASDPQVVAVRAVLLSMEEWRTRLGRPSVKMAQPVPDLNWPDDLFKDESIDN